MYLPPITAPAEVRHSHVVTACWLVGASGDRFLCRYRDDASRLRDQASDVRDTHGHHGPRWVEQGSPEAWKACIGQGAPQTISAMPPQGAIFAAPATQAPVLPRLRTCLGHAQTFGASGAELVAKLACLIVRSSTPGSRDNYDR